MSKRILLLGGDGQLGWEIQRLCSADQVLKVCNRSALDITDAERVAEVVSEFQPNAIINAAAYTAVDKAESDADQAFAVNTQGAINLALAASNCGARLVQISTDYVFDGKTNLPYSPTAVKTPQGCYGKSKADAEDAIVSVFDHVVIIRTSWLYSSHGNNFVKTMLRLINEREELKVVADQLGAPTWAAGLARVALQAASSDTDVKYPAIYHWSDLGVASWYDFAKAIQEIGEAQGLVAGGCKIVPISTAEYPTPAKRPAYSVLDKTSTLVALGLEGQYWRDALADMLLQLSQMTASEQSELEPEHGSETEREL